MPLIRKAGRMAALCAALALAFLNPASAREYRAGDLIVVRPWTRATPPDAEVAGGYVTVVNTGRTADRLLGGTFEAASGFEVHDMTVKDGIMRMRPSGAIEIPAGGVLTLAPSGRHIMFTGLKHPIARGQTVEGALSFERAGSVPVSFDVEALGSKGPGAAKGSGHAGPSMPGMDMD